MIKKEGFMFEEFNVLDMNLPVFKLINNSWMLITAGNLENHNTMTASWGGMGIVWHTPMITIFVRPQRYTKQFLDREKFFTISFYEEKYKDALSFCGTHSGSDVNKDEKINFHPFKIGGSVAYEEASLVFYCEKTFSTAIDENKILNKNIVENFYKEKDFHEIYIGKIEKTIVKKPNQLF